MTGLVVVAVVLKAATRRTQIRRTRGEKKGRKMIMFYCLLAFDSIYRNN